MLSDIIQNVKKAKLGQIPNDQEQDQNDLQLLLGKFNLNDYLKNELIGSGKFGKVYKVKNKITNQIYSAKISIDPIDENSEEMIENISREVNIISKLNHCAILKFIGYSITNFKKKLKPVLVTEYVENGTLSDLMYNSNDIFNDTRKLIIIYGIASAMSYLHSHDIIHRDLKPENILIDKYLHPKLADFGLSKQCDQKYYQTIDNAIKGTPKYISPEIWNKGTYSKACDVYAFAIIVYEIITDQIAYQNLNMFQIIKKISEQYRPDFQSPIPNSYKELIEKCWSQDPNERPTFDQIVEQLVNDKDFITEKVNEEEFIDYVKFVNEYETSFNESNNVDINELMNSRFNHFTVHKTKATTKIDDKLYKAINFISYNDFITLDDECKRLINDAENDPETSFFIGQSFIEGKYNFPIKIQTGIQFLNFAIKNNCTNALIYYINMLIKGKYIPKNHKKAKKLIDNKIPRLEGTFSMLYGKLFKNENDYSKAKTYFEESMKLGNLEAMYEYAQILFKEQNEESINYYQKLIQQSYLPALYKYGSFLMKENNEEEGINYIKTAAEKGYSKASYQYYNILEKKDPTTNKEKSNQYLKEAAEQGIVEAIRKYALYLLNEKNNFEEILYILKKACDKGDIESIFEYGKALIDHKNDDKSLLEGARYLRIAAENGHSDSMRKYAEILLNGKGADINVEEAINYYKMAIEKGNAEAMHDYADMLYYGNGIEINKEEAVKYYKMAIEHDHTPTMVQFTLIAMHDDDIPFNYKESLKYLERANEKNDETSIKLLNELKANMFQSKEVEEEVLKNLETINNSPESEKSGILLNMLDLMGLNEEEKQACLQFYEQFRYNSPEQLNELFSQLYTGQLPMSQLFGGQNPMAQLFGNQLPTGQPPTGQNPMAQLFGNQNPMAQLFGNQNPMAQLFGNQNPMAQLFGNQPPTDQPPTGQNPMAQLFGNQNPMAQLFGNQPPTDQPPTDQPPTDQPPTDQPPTGQNPMAQLFGNQNPMAQLFGNQNPMAQLFGNQSTDIQKYALNTYKIMSDSGSVESMYQYAYMCYEGIGTEVNKEEAAKYFRKAAEKGDEESLSFYEEIICYEDIPTINKEEALEFIRREVNKSHNAEVIYGLAMILRTGVGIQNDKVEAVKYYKKAADLGFEQAIFYYARIVDKGDGAPVNKEEAAKYYKMGADLGHVQSMSDYAVKLYLGEGTEMNLIEAAKYFKMAADKGHAYSMYVYAEMLRCGKGIPLNKEEAFKYYKKAADKGHVKSMYKYAVMNDQGEGTSVNKEEAIKYFKLAAMKGDDSSINKLSSMGIQIDE